MEKIKIDAFKEFHFLSQLQGKGDYLSYVMAQADMDKNDYTSSIYLYDLKAKKHRRLTNGQKDGAYLWLNDQEILFRGKRDQGQEKTKAPETVFYKINIHGGEAEKYLTLPYQVGKILFLDDKTCFFTASFIPALDKIKDLEGHEKDDYLKSLKEEEDYEVIEEIPFWFNGAGFTEGARTALYRYDLETKKAEKLTKDSFDLQGFIYEKAYKSLYISGEDFQGKASIYNRIYEIKEEGLVDISPFKGDYEYIKWTQVSQEELIIYGTDCKTYGVNENGKFYLYNKVTGACKVLTEDFEMSTDNSIGSDLRYGTTPCPYAKIDEDIIFPVLDHYKIKLMRLGAHRPMEEFMTIEGSLDEYIYHEDTFYGIASLKDSAQELYRLDKENLETLSQINSPYLSSVDVRPADHFAFENRAGMLIDGFILRPLEFDPQKTYPTILDIHGGPKTVYGEILYHEMQYWANEGYVVIFCNPRGSDGGDSDFADIRGKYGTIDYEDIMDFVDEAILRFPFIDVNKMGVTGGSYGGFMTNWIIGHTDRFKVAASQRSIANWSGFFGTSDIGYYFAPDQVGATPWSNIEAVWEQSPLKYADRVKTPTLFIHSDEDYRCNIPEGYQMFTALKYHGVEARMVQFKGENHELSRGGKPKHRLRRLQEITDWMDKHLKNQN